MTVVLTILAALLLAGAVLAVAVVYNTRYLNPNWAVSLRDSQASHLILPFGAGVDDHFQPRRPSPQSQRVIQETLMHWYWNRDNAVIAGIGAGYKNGAASEALVFWDELRRQGVPSEAILPENRSFNTILNAIAFAKAVQAKRWNWVVVVAERHHANRVFSTVSAIWWVMGVTYTPYFCQTPALKDEEYREVYRKPFMNSQRRWVSWNWLHYLLLYPTVFFLKIFRIVGLFRF